VNGLWTVSTAGADGAARETIQARILVNAAGPWVGKVLHGTIGSIEPAKARLVQGSHIVVPRLYDHDRCYIFQNSDDRIIFAIPYETDYTLIGTTDRDYAGDPADVKATLEEIAYLCESTSAYFTRAITPADVVWSYSGVRSLFDDGADEAQAATRDYVLKLDTARGAPILSIFGGKITTYRRLAERAMEKLAGLLPRSAPRWTAASSLPGGDFPVKGYEAVVDALKQSYPFLTTPHARRLVRLYGTRAGKILGGARRAEDLGRDFGATLTEAEVRYLVREEWARTVEDVIWRRTKLGLRRQSMDLEALAKRIDEECRMLAAVDGETGASAEVVGARAREADQTANAGG
jgi:glycerol-3-phosphate dehydrogenase